jgi:hypothetical protein
MSASSPRRLLVVANRTAATPTLLDTVRGKAAEGTTAVTLLEPAFPTVFDPESLQSRHTVELAIPLLEEATGTSVQGIVGDPDRSPPSSWRSRRRPTTRSSSPRCPHGSRAGSSATCHSESSDSASP